MLLSVLASAPLAAFEVDFRVEGADAGIEVTLRDSSAVLQAQDEGTTNPQDLFAAAEAEYGRLVGALYAEGYYSPVINVLIDGREAATIPPLNAPASIGTITVMVRTGPPFRFGTARIAPLATGTELPVGFATGQPARSEVVRESVAAAIGGWRDVGHAKAATATQSVVADHRTARLSADITIAPGQRLRFGALRITGQERMRPERIREIAGLPEGRVFSPADLDRSAERLRRTGVFRAVTLAEDDAVTPPDLLGITATVIEEKPRHYSLGAEVASFDGLTLSAEWIHRNLFGGAERLTIGGEVTNIEAQDSGVDYTLGISLSRPATFTPDTTVGVALDLSKLDEEDFSTEMATLGLTATHYFSDRLTGRAALEYTTGTSTDAAGTLDTRQLALPLGLTFDSRDEPLDATKGIYADVEVMPFLGFDESASGTRATLDARAYRGFGADRRFVLAGRVQAGAIFGADIATTPRDMLFYSGGGGTVRGHPYQSLGVAVLRDGGPRVETGGTLFLGASVELRTRVTDRIGVVGFYDVGQISALDFDNSGGTHSGAGLGLRYETGFGPIRLDVATPVSGGTGDGVQLYVGIGQAF
jgi:translocation and assembly module TamA